MIRLKSGTTVKHEKNLDAFFQKIIDAIITDSKKTVNDNVTDFELLELNENLENLNELYFREMMDNCIIITNQLFEIQKKFPKISKFIISGFIFNAILIAIQSESIRLKAEAQEQSKPKNETIH